MADYEYDQVFSAFHEIAKDFTTHPERINSAIILMSLGTPETPGDDKPRQDFKAWMDFFFSGGVPVIVASGNDRQNHEVVHELPQKLASKDYPVINVGGAAPDGSRADFSQGGDEWQLSIYAPGEAVDTQSSTVDGGIVSTRGTSIGECEASFHYFLHCRSAKALMSSSSHELSKRGIGSDHCVIFDSSYRVLSLVRLH